MEFIRILQPGERLADVRDLSEPESPATNMVLCKMGTRMTLT
jgi:hypothetical protein